MSLENTTLTLVTSMEDVISLFQWLGQSRPYHALGLDTETEGLDPKIHKIRTVQVGDHTHGWVIPWETWRGLFIDILNRWDGRWILHNAPFDMSMFDVAGVHIPRHAIDDTMIEAHILEPHMSRALKEQSTRHIDPAASALQSALEGTKWTWANVPIDYEPYWTYGALDPILAYRLHQHHYPTILNTARRSYELEMSVLWVVERMRRYGTHIDTEYTRENFEKFMTYCEQVEQWCAEHYNVKPGSNQAIIEILQNDGVDFVKRTKSNALSLDAEVLETIDHPLAQAVLGRRQAQKMASTYLRFYLNNVDENSLIHPEFNTLGARTGRMSCSNPNLQNLPRHGTSKFGDVIRNCVNSRYGDDGVLMMCDFDQIEMRVLAHAAGEQRMIDAFKSDGDFFVNLARELFEDNTIQKSDPRRQITKTSAYATIYAAGLSKFAITAGISMEQARSFRARWNNLYTQIYKFQNDMLKLGAERQHSEGRPYTSSLLTNRKFVADPNKVYTLVNYAIQGMAAEINKMKLVELSRTDVADYMFATVHDEVLLDVPRDIAHDVAHVLDDVMTDHELLSVPITSGVSWGARWGEKKDYNID